MRADLSEPWVHFTACAQLKEEAALGYGNTRDLNLQLALAPTDCSLEL